MQTYFQLARQLSDGQFHSGEALAANLGISRSAVWKQLQSLKKQYAIEVHSVRGRGYRFARPIELFDKDSIIAELPDDSASSLESLHILSSVDSTNAWMMRQLSSNACSGKVCLAEHQTQGKGRHGRTWVSPFGANIYLSLLSHFDLPPMGLQGLSLAAGLAVIKALHDMGIEDAGLKWPNDILLNQKKLAGILLEMVGEASGPCRVVLGVGVNLQLSQHQGQDIDQPWTDLSDYLSPAKPFRNPFAARLLHHLLLAVKTFSEQGFSSFIEDWNRYDLFLGKPVCLVSGANSIEGIHCGIDSNGAILLDSAGQIKPYYAGEVSLRKVK